MMTRNIRRLTWSLAAFTTLLSSPFASAYSAAPCEQHFVATDGTHIDLSYLLSDVGGGDGFPASAVVEPLTVTVSGPDVDTKDPVRLVWVDVQRPDVSGPEPRRAPTSQDFDLHPAGRHQASATGRLFQVYDGEPEIAVVIGGRWLVDPISGTSNFKFELGSTCAR